MGVLTPSKSKTFQPGWVWPLEGNTLVADAVGFDEGHWLDRSGDVTGTWSITKIFQ